MPEVKIVFARLVTLFGYIITAIERLQDDLHRVLCYGNSLIPSKRLPDRMAWLSGASEIRAGHLGRGRFSACGRGHIRVGW